MEWWTSLFNSVQQWLFESVIQPVMFHLGMASLLEDGYDATGWLLVGLWLTLCVRTVVMPRLQAGGRPLRPAVIGIVEVAFSSAITWALLV